MSSNITIRLQNVAKRYQNKWLFKNLNIEFLPGSSTAILGPNGIGKSTLIKIITGYVSASNGTILWEQISDNQVLEPFSWHQRMAMAAPYFELMDEFTMKEMIDLHFSLKTMRKEIDLNIMLEKAGLEAQYKKQLGLFSSGMKQRLKLVLAFASQVEVLILDEPCSNLDEAGFTWYEELILHLPKETTVIIGSNISREHQFCKHSIELSHV
ncbi:MAG: ABC-type multidrug transport system ATPase subunit [Bacteroidia bacterium]|jgi:ABC-type multidrug transport system ATPase subunit